MEFWLDAQLDPKLAAWLGSTFGVTAKTVKEIGLRDESDLEIFKAARRFGDIVIVTKDYDLAELVDRLGSPPRVVLIGLGNTSTIALQVYLRKVFPKALLRLDGGESVVELR